MLRVSRDGQTRTPRPRRKGNALLRRLRLPAPNNNAAPVANDRRARPRRRLERERRPGATNNHPDKPVKDDACRRDADRRVASAKDKPPARRPDDRRALLERDGAPVRRTHRRNAPKPQHGAPLNVHGASGAARRDLRRDALSLQDDAPRQPPDRDVVALGRRDNQSQFPGSLFSCFDGSQQFKQKII